jgi:hypothetical protein
MPSAKVGSPICSCQRATDKVAADQRGHGLGLGVSLEVYSISDLQQKIEAVKKIESEVIQ